MLRVELDSSSSPSTSQTPPPHPLHSLLKPVLLTSRASSQKYHSRIAQLLVEEDDPADAEEEYVWYAYHKDKIADTDADAGGQDGQDEHETHERLKVAWLERMERREVQIQILLHYLLLTLPGNDAPSLAGVQPDPADALPLPPPLSPSKSKKRKRKERGTGQGVPPRAAPPGPKTAPAQPLEECLESYMDKLAMWQLMRSVDSTLGHPAPAAPESAAHGKQKDGRDWMQAFFEDVVEPLFRDRLPELCALFRSKLFPDTAGSDTDTVDLTPPTSPKPAPKRLKAGAADGAGPSKAKARTKEDVAQRSRSRSLSMSLEQEQRERSRSVSIGPSGLRKRAINREVSMTTVFKGKERAKNKAALARTTSQVGPSLQRTQSQSTAQTSTADKGTKGNVLVAATPSKPRTAHQSQTQTVQTRLPALFGSASQSQSQSRVARVEDSIDDDIAADDDAFATPTKVRRHARTTRVVSDGEGGDDAGDEWKLDSSPDVLLLGATGPREWGTPHTQSPPLSSSPADLGGFSGSHSADHGGRPQGRVLVGDTPTKAR
ncbi:DNA replication regulator SLD3-domain-containing protein [Trametes meyenii]|nr:DNA replication regulator SLD3-domain-containing protein [Trametes meyenii]